MFSFANDGLITRINAKLLRDLDHKAKDVIGKKKLEDLLTVGSRIFFQTHFYPLIKMQGFANEIFLSFLSRSGTDIPVLLNVCLEKNGDQFEIHCGGMQISNRNRFEKEILEAKKVAEKALIENEDLVTLRNTLEKQQQLLEFHLRKLSQKNRQQREINKVLSHDLQEPLRKISFFSDKLYNDQYRMLDFPAKSNLERIISSVERVRSLLDSLQKFNALEDKELKYSEIDLKVILKEAAHYAGIAQSGDIDIEYGKFPVFSADTKLMTALFFELFTNSKKFRQQKPLQISIQAVSLMHNIFVEMRDQYLFAESVRITFSDNGSGIAPPVDKVFDIFRKARHDDIGIGMGLTYCKKIVELHNGTISIDSWENVGTTVTIILPISEVSPESASIYANATSGS